MARLAPARATTTATEPKMTLVRTVLRRQSHACSITKLAIRPVISGLAVTITFIFGVSAATARRPAPA
eukprot:6186026-Prymnesium_polylepis.2